MKRRLFSALIAGLLASTAGLCAAQDFPSKPIRLVIPFPPGGGTDFVSRTVGTKLGETTGWTIVLENRPGAGGNIAIESVSKAAPDGYTIVMGQSDNMMLGPFLYANVGYDSVKSFEAIVRVSAAPLVVVSAAGSKITDPVSLAAAGKSARGITWGTAGNGTVGHLFGEQIKAAMGINLVQVPYKGASPAMTDVIGGAVDVAILSVGSVLPHIRSGKAQPVAVTSAARSPVVADAKTFAEAGYKDVDVMIWLGLFAPAGTPAAIVARLNEAVNRVLAMPDIQQKIVGQGVSVGG
ncbi:MAG: tripartite tricarboxylate transporter substrate binding protein, partial [Betaproteobacteria bacterium]|nr:tripartite tricarboxylate transporter substrate binding protein [Betaproteobacteria bacterium]